MTGQILLLVGVVVLVILLFLGTRLFEIFTGDILGKLVGTNKVDRVVLFSSSDCHVCQELKKNAWPKLINDFPDIKFEDINCVNSKEICVQYGIYAFPTIILARGELLEYYKGSWQYPELYAAIVNKN